MGRTVDPGQTVSRAIEQRRGFVDQADIREEQRARERLGGVGDTPQDLEGPVTLTGDQTITEGLLRVEINNDDVDGLVVGPVFEETLGDYYTLSYKRSSVTGLYTFQLVNGGGFPTFLIQQNLDGTATVQFRQGSTFEVYDGTSTLAASFAATGRLTITTNDTAAILVEKADGTDAFQVNPLGIISIQNGMDLRLYSDSGSTEEGRWDSASGVLTAASPHRWESGAHHDPGATTLSVVGMPAWTVGTVTSADDADGSWAAFSTTNITNNATGPNGPLSYRRDWDFDVTFRIKTVSTTSVRYHIGLYASDPSGTASPTINCAGFRYDTSVGDTTWRCRFGDGSAGASVDSGVTFAGNTAYTLRMVGLYADEVRFYIDGALVATRTTNLPTATALLAPYIRVTTLSANIRTVYFGFFNALSK